jgi:carbamoyltransferase
MTTYILGLSCYYHDSSAALLRNGIIVAAAQEERFTRKKHDTSFPIYSINYCLQSQNITIDDISYIGFYEKPFLKFERVLFQHLEMFPWSLRIFLTSMPSWINERLSLPKTLSKRLGYKGDVLFVNHHLAHAASSFLVSPFQRAAIMTVDGVGEWTTTAYGMGDGNNIQLFKEIRFPHSIGLLYSTITAYLGFTVNNSEYKVMGLSSYGKMSKRNPYYDKLKKVIDIKEDGSFCLDMSYFVYHYKGRMPSKKFCELLGGPVRKPGSEVTHQHKDIAAALQMITEEVLTKMLCHLHREAKCDELVIAGGVGLNSVYNGKILHKTPFRSVWIQPDPGDGGTSIGAAVYVYNAVLNKKRMYHMKSSYLGPVQSTAEIRSFLKSNEIRHSEFRNNKELICTTARLILENNVVGWFQGRMEWGPRALGNRSILANPCNTEMKAILNLKVKHRELFRPFAPVVCVDDVSKYFDCDNPLPEPTDFMLMVYPIKKEFQSKIPAVTHVDGTGRLQTIRRFQNQLYYDLIKEFGKISGVQILINTSFNIRGEPIVCTPRDAYRCMMGTGIDYLVMDRFLVKREDNPSHMWDSERYAKD